jgi:seryl-tRNA synthetase
LACPQAPFRASPRACWHWISAKDAELKALMLKLPGIPYEAAPVGPDESFNEVIRTVGEPRKFDFEPLDHVALIEKNGWGDLSRVTQVSGSRTYCLKGALALLETKLMGWALTRIAEAGFTPITVPAIARGQAFLNQGQFPGHEEETYQLPEAQSAEWHAKLLGLAESLLAALDIPYQVIETSTGDMGLGKYRMNDIESWVPSLGKYRETHSCSTLHDWQARRANIRYRGSDGKVRFAHTLNNTALASPRILVPLLENHQTADGRVRLPSAMQELMGSEYL